MAKKKTSIELKEDFEIELEGLIEQNENMANGIKKIINSIENKKPSKK